MTLHELARLIDAHSRGDGEIELTGVGPLDSARGGEVAYVADAARLEQAGRSEASALIVPQKLADHVTLGGRRLLVAKDAKLAFARAIAVFHSKPYKARGVSPDLILGENSRIGAECSIHPRVTIGRDSVIGDRVTLHPGVVIGDNCRIGDDTVIFPNVTIYDETEIGARCRIHSGSVIGADGFSFTPDEEGRQLKLLQVGRVVIEDDVEIGANCCVDRAGFDLTRVRRGAKFDNRSRSATTSRSAKTPSWRRSPGFRAEPRWAAIASLRARSEPTSTLPSAKARPSPPAPASPRASNPANSWAV
jgi:UDP-3-O-[3-hydroxymyristoyl] glucosamine N-acyltransferase